MKSVEDQAWDDYIADFNKRKNEMMSKLETIRTDIHTHKVYRAWIEQVIEFIKEQKG